MLPGVSIETWPSTGDPTWLFFPRFVLKELPALLLGSGERFLILDVKALRFAFAQGLAVTARALAVTELEVLRFITRPLPQLHERRDLLKASGHQVGVTVDSPEDRGGLHHMERRPAAFSGAFQVLQRGVFQDVAQLIYQAVGQVVGGFPECSSIKTVVGCGLLGHCRAPASYRACQSVAIGAYGNRSSLDWINMRRLVCFGGNSKHPARHIGFAAEVRTSWG